MRTTRCLSQIVVPTVVWSRKIRSLTVNSWDRAFSKQVLDVQRGGSDIVIDYSKRCNKLPESKGADRRKG